MHIYYDISEILHIFADELQTLCKCTNKKPINSKFNEFYHLW